MCFDCATDLFSGFFFYLFVHLDLFCSSPFCSNTFLFKTPWIDSFIIFRSSSSLFFHLSLPLLISQALVCSYIHIPRLFFPSSVFIWWSSFIIRSSLAYCLFFSLCDILDLVLNLYFHWFHGPFFSVTFSLSFGLTRYWSITAAASTVEFLVSTLNFF